MRYNMRKLLTLCAILFAFNMAAQSTLSVDNPILKIENRKYTLLDIDDMGRAHVRYEEFENGQLSTSGTYYNNTLDGIWNLYDENGNITASVVYNRGKKISYTTFVDNKKMVVNYLDNKPVRIVTEISLASN